MARSDEVPWGEKAPASGWFIWVLPITKTTWKRYQMLLRRERVLGTRMKKTEASELARLRRQLKAHDIDDALPLNVRFAGGGGL